MPAAGYRVLDADKLIRLRDPAHSFGLDVLVGLSGRPKRIASKYFYDDIGSEYFRRIMELPEYYLTKCEFAVLEENAAAIVAATSGDPLQVIDLGAGDGQKTILLLRALADARADFVYVPIDISAGSMEALVARVRAELPRVKISGLVCDYADGLQWLRAQDARRRNLVLFLGSNIGNFDRAHSQAFLRRLWIALRDGDLALVGFDMKKDIELLLQAYSDSQGVTAAFNLNLLERINRELGGTFDVTRFRHYGTYDVHTGAMTSYLVSLVEQTVWIAELAAHFRFDPWEPIHTEYSYKYLPSDIESLAAATGFTIAGQFSDRRGWFVDALWRAKKDHKARIMRTL